MTQTLGFEEDCQEAVGELRAALMELYARVGAPLEAPQDVSRGFSLNKNLTWKLARIIGASEPNQALQHLPGSAGMRILLAAMAKAGPEDALLERVRDAYDRVERVVEVHVGDRSTLELVLDGQNPNEDERLEVSRKIAFRGNSGVWGVQAHSKMMLAILAPTPGEPRLLDVVFVRGFVGFRRLRSELSWPISVRRDWSGEGDPFPADWQPLEPDQVRAGLPVLSEFSTSPLPRMDMHSTGDGVQYVLAPGPVGNTAAFDCFFADVHRGGAERYRTDGERHGTFVSAITVPVEHQLVDVIVHESLVSSFAPEAVVYGDPYQGIRMSYEDQERCRLPISERVHRLPGSPPIVATPLFARYGEMVEHVFARVGWDAGAFRGVRLVVKYPPMGSHVAVRFELPVAPG